ncbi:MAG: TetR/AcrR family transcriptional regulator [Myxococcales bacterium]|nr:TetR/AcrR family transcriptional regulator [Myxococcales bacterium]
MTTRPPKTEPRAYHHGDLRRALIVATKAIVEESGAESFTLREAARRAGVNHRAAYRHFEDKSALLAAVAEEGFVELSSRIEAALAREPEGASSRRLMAIARAYVEFASQNRGAYRVMAGPRLNIEDRFPALEAAIGKNLDLVRHEIEQGIARGKLRKVDPLDTTLALWAATHGLSTLVLTRRVKVRPALVGELTERLLGDLLSGLAKKR